MFSWRDKYKQMYIISIGAILGLMLTLFTQSGLAAEPGPGYYNLGEPATDEQIAGWNIDVRPDGKGLPEGSGSVQEGEGIYETRCAVCHGSFGEGASGYPELSGGEGSLTDERPEQTVGSYWPYATTLWDYINRAMPYNAPNTMSNDEVYAVVAYVLELNGIVGVDFVADQNSLVKVEMPNASNFYREDPRPDTDNSSCMKNCKNVSEIEIISSAEGKVVTPSTAGPLQKEMTQ